jgi:digeranylgeranylglycerophospholipid reductase
METDIAVIGAGPSGSFSALTAAKQGAKVAVFEEHPTIGVPVHCAGHLSLSGLRRLGLKLPSPIVENTFKGAIFFSPSGKQFSVRFPSSVTCVVNRELFDKHLANIASNMGVQYFLDAKVKALVLQHDAIKGVLVSRKDKTEEIVSNIIIDAEGVSSTVLKSVGLKSLGNEVFVKAVSAEVDNIKDVENDCVEFYLDGEIADGFYAWIIPKRDGTAKIGLATNRGNPRQCLERFMKSHGVASHKLSKSRIARLSYHSIPLGGPIPKTYANGFLVVGDAARQVKPTTGGGVVMGLICAQIAGEVAAQAVKAGNFPENFLKSYEERWKQEIGYDMRLMVFARKLLNRLSNREIDKLFAIATKLRLNETLIRVKDVDFQGKEVMRLAKRPSALLTLTYFLFSTLT